jgi:23S rRNA (uracil1939-C5)-methyltransferase
MELRLEIEKMVSKGEGLARHEGKTVFVEGALPGETVLAEETTQKSDFSRAVTVEVIAPSEHRSVPACPHYGVCGGCDMQHASTESQVQFKQEFVKENLKRIGSIDIDDPEADIELLEAVTGEGWGYRSRVRFHVDLENERCGFLGRGSKDLVDIHHCPILCDPLNRLLDEKRPLLLKAAAMRKATEGWQSKKPFVEVPAFAGDTKVSLSATEVSVVVEGKTLWADSNVFFQSNRQLLPAMTTFVAEHTVGDTVVDLYAGVGTFSAFVEREGRTVYAVERNKRCIDLAKKNLAYTEFVGQTAEHWSRMHKDIKVDTVIVDPPRTGLEASVVKTIGSWEPQAIVYISCDSVTLARDCKRFSEQGYRVKTVQVFDLYPQTSHVETACLLVRS